MNIIEFLSINYNLFFKKRTTNKERLRLLSQLGKLDEVKRLVEKEPELSNDSESILLALSENHMKVAIYLIDKSSLDNKKYIFDNINNYEVLNDYFNKTKVTKDISILNSIRIGAYIAFIVILTSTIINGTRKIIGSIF